MTSGSFSNPDSGRTLEVPARPLFPQRNPDPGYGDRITPLEAYIGAGKQLPVGTITVKAIDRNDGLVVINDPITGAPMTQSMMEIVDLTPDDLQDMVDRVAPLGVNRNDWQAALQLLHDAFGQAGLLDEQLVIKVGGSSTHGFSSRATARSKKQVPRDTETLERGIANYLKAKSDYTYERAQFTLRDAQDKLRHAVGHLDEKPTAPWWGLLHELGLEDQPDIDIQIYSPAIDDIVLRSERFSDLIQAGQRSDRWGRWDPRAVHREFQSLDRLRRTLKRHRLPLDLEYLAGQSGRARIDGRQDWWTIKGPQPR